MSAVDFLSNPLLPSPPSDAEKWSYANPSGLGISATTLFLVAAFGGGSWLFVQGKNEWLFLYLFFAGVVCVGLLWNAYVYACSKPLDSVWFDFKRRDYINRTGYCPTADIFLPSCGEPLDLLDSNYFAISKIQYPKVKVWVCDDSDRPEVGALARRYGFEYHVRPIPGEDKKAGSLRYLFARSEGELIVVFDADFCPRADFLNETTWLFGENEDLGLLQTPHFFQVKSMQPIIERGASHLQHIFFRCTQIGRDKFGAAICCGSNAVYRRAALLSNGGSALEPRSEDVATGCVVIIAGYKVRYLPMVLAAGLSPASLRAIVSQLYRWCIGCYQTRTSGRYLWRRGVPWRVRLIYSSSALYFFTTGIGVVGFGVPGLVNLLFYPDHIYYANYMAIVPAILLMYVVRARWSTMKWDSSILYVGFLSGYIYLVATFDFLTGQAAPWIPTGAKRKKGRQLEKVLFCLQWIPTIGLILCAMGLFKNYALIPPYAWTPTIGFWMVKFWASRLILKQDYRENSADSILAVVGEYEREKAMLKHYAPRDS